MRRRRGRTAVIVVVVLLALVVSSALMAHRMSEARALGDATARHAAAVTAVEQARRDHDSAQEELSSAVSVADGALTTTASLVTVTDVLPAADVTTLSTERTTLQTARDEAPTLDPLPDAPTDPPPTTTDALDTAADELEASAAVLTDSAQDAQAAADALADATVEVQAAADALLATVPDASQTYLEQYPSSTHQASTTMQLAALDVVTTLGPDSGTQVAAFVAAAQDVAASHADQEYLLAHPVHPSRPLVEEFSRSIAGGVPIDFGWEPIVNGLGTDGSSGGEATWNTAPYSYSTITLSSNVAELWPEEGVRALVAHETGHAITSKCYTIFAAPPFNSDDEMWATAWAISMGFDDGNGSGEWLYGRPSQEQIDAAAQCR